MIYFMRHPDTGLIKIGTTVNIYNRLSQLITQHGDLELMGLLEGSYETESELHKRFADCHEQNADGREWFRAESSLLDFIETNTHLNLPSQQQMTTIAVRENTLKRVNEAKFELMARERRQLSNDEIINLLLDLLDKQTKESESK